MLTKLRSIALAALLTVGSAHGVMLTGAFTGAWFNEDAPGQGLLLQVVEVEGTPTAVVYWFTFDASGNQLWLVGQGAVDGNRVTLTLLEVTGGVLTMAGFDPSALELDEWGELSLEFSDCDHGTARFSALDPAIAGGEFELTRLTKSLGDDCSGGLSDNSPPGMGAFNLKVDFVNTGEAPAASGSVKFEHNANHSKLKVKVKKLPPGVYDLTVDGEPVGEIEVNNGGNGKLFFRSPQTCNWELLDFDPRNTVIDVVLDGVIYLTAFLDAGEVDELPDETDDEGSDDDSSDDEGSDDEESCD